MLRWIIVILLVLWLCVLVCVGVNIYNQYQIGRQNMRIIKDYEVKSAIDDDFKTAHDSLDKDIALAEQNKAKLSQSFPLQDAKLNWLLLRLAIVFLAVVTVITYWVYYKKQAQD